MALFPGKESDWSGQSHVTPRGRGIATVSLEDHGCNIGGIAPQNMGENAGTGTGEGCWVGKNSMPSSLLKDSFIIPSSQK